MNDFQELLDNMRHAQPSRTLDRLVHQTVFGRRPWSIPHYTSDFEAAYGLLIKSEVTLLELTGGWEPSQPEAHPAWAVQYYTRERPPKTGDKGGWFGAIAAGVNPQMALCRVALTVIARARGLKVDPEK